MNYLAEYLTGNLQGLSEKCRTLPPYPPNFGGNLAQSPPESPPYQGGVGDLGGVSRTFDTFQTSSQSKSSNSVYSGRVVSICSP